MRLLQTLSGFCAASSVRQCAGGLHERRLDRAPGDPTREPARLLQVPRDDLHEIIRAPGQDRHPIGEAHVQLRATALRDLPVRDVAHEDVLERVLLLVRDRRDGAVQDEIAPLERVEPCEIRGRPLVLGADVRDRARPEHGADHGGVVRKSLVSGLQPVKAGADESLDARRHR